MLSFLKTNEDHKQKTNEDYKPTKINSNFNTELAAKVAVENERFANLPPVRECGVVEFSFSERQFPAPKRESNKGGLILEGILLHDLLNRTLSLSSNNIIHFMKIPSYLS